MAGMWVFVAFLALGLGLGVWALARMGGGGGRAHDILAERMARGEITLDEYRERLDLVGSPSRGRIATPVAAALIVVGVIGVVAAAAFSMGRDGMDRVIRGRDMSEMMRMMGGESGRDGAEPKAGARERRVTADEFSFDPEVIRVPVGETVNIVFENHGRMFHTFTAAALDFELRAQGDETISGAIRAPAGGTYNVVCTVPGHAEAGMKATVVARAD